MTKKVKIEFPHFISQKLTRDIETILFDYSSGSQEINEKILKLILRLHSKRTLKFLIEIFKDNFQTFQVVQETLNEIERNLDKEELNSIKQKIRENLKANSKRIEAIFDKLKTKLKSDIKILTISNSKTVYETIRFIHSKNYKPEIFVLESKPGGEGILLYQKLKQLEMKVHLVKDKEMKKILGQVDLILIGADKILLNKWFINKVKTKKLLTLAKQKELPVLLLAFREKIIKTETLIEHSQKLRPDKNLFEKIDLKLVDEILIG